MPELTPLRLACPACGGDLVYTCEPTCCFNHVCAACRRTFYPSSALTGRTLPGLPRLPAPEGTAAALACDGCGALAVGLLGDDPVCTACGAVLALRLDDSPP